MHVHKSVIKMTFSGLNITSFLDPTTVEVVNTDSRFAAGGDNGVYAPLTPADGIKLVDESGQPYNVISVVPGVTLGGASAILVAPYVKSKDSAFTALAKNSDAAGVQTLNQYVWSFTGNIVPEPLTVVENFLKLKAKAVTSAVGASAVIYLIQARF